MTTDEEIVDIQWLFQGHSDEIIAMFSHGTFVPLPAFSQRATHLPNAGIALSHVTVADTGNYSVEVTGRNSGGGQFALRRSVFVKVSGLFSRTRFFFFFFLFH